MHILAFAESIQLFPDGTIFIHIGLIIFMIWLLNRTLFKPINKVLSSREKNSRTEGGEAGEILREVSDKESKYSAEILDARSKGYSLIEKEQNKASEVRAKKLAEAKTESAAALDAGKAELEQQAAAAHAAIGTESEKMAEKIAASILKS